MNKTNVVKFAPTAEVQRIMVQTVRALKMPLHKITRQSTGVEKIVIRARNQEIQRENAALRNRFINQCVRDYLTEHYPFHVLMHTDRSTLTA